MQEHLVDTDLKTNAQALDISYHQIRDLEAELLAQTEQMAWYEEAGMQAAAQWHVGLDEHAMRRGHKYVSILYEKTHKKLLHMCRGRKKDDLVKMLEEIPAPQRGKIKTVTIDRSPPMLGAVKAVLDQAVIIIDKFHLIRDCGKVVNTVRKRLKCEEAQRIEAEYRAAVKGLTEEEKRQVKKRSNIYSQVRHHLLRRTAYWKINRKESPEKRKKKAEGYAQLEQALAASTQLRPCV